PGSRPHLLTAGVVTAQRPGQGHERAFRQVGVVGGAAKGRVDDRHLGGGESVGGDVGVRLAVGVSVGTLDAAVALVAFPHGDVDRALPAGVAVAGDDDAAVVAALVLRAGHGQI